MRRVFSSKACAGIVGLCAASWRANSHFPRVDTARATWAGAQAKNKLAGISNICLMSRGGKQMKAGVLNLCNSGTHRLASAQAACHSSDFSENGQFAHAARQSQCAWECDSYCSCGINDDGAAMTAVM